MPASERSRPYVQYLVVFALVVVLGAALARVVLVPAESCFSVSEPSLRTGVTEAIGWFERNQNADGSWLYRYDREANQDLGSYNAVRHSGVMMSLTRRQGRLPRRPRHR